MMKGLQTYGIGHLVEKARENYFLVDEFVDLADSYFHYSNYILFEISGRVTIAYLLLLLTDSHGFVIGFLLISSIKPVCLLYFRFKENPASFEWVIERYCGVPP